MGRKLKSAELRAAGLCRPLGVMVSRAPPLHGGLTSRRSVVRWQPCCFDPRVVPTRRNLQFAWRSRARD